MNWSSKDSRWLKMVEDGIKNGWFFFKTQDGLNESLNKVENGLNLTT